MLSFCNVSKPFFSEVKYNNKAQFNIGFLNHETKHTSQSKTYVFWFIYHTIDNQE